MFRDNGPFPVATALPIFLQSVQKVGCAAKAALSEKVKKQTTTAHISQWVSLLKYQQHRLPGF
jgi:hypothetical protein